MDAIRIGKISSINREEGTARILFEDREDAVSPEIPFLFYEIYPYKVDDLVWVAKLGRSTTDAVILGMAFSEVTPPAETMADGVYRKDFGREAGNAYIRYDAGSNTLKISGTGTVNIEAGGSVNISAPGGDVTVSGVSLKNHTHTAPDGETSAAH